VHSVYPVRDLYPLEPERRLNPNAIPQEVQHVGMALGGAMGVAC